MSEKTVAAVEEWLETAGQHHLGDTARLMQTALARMAHCRTVDEPDDVAWMLEHIDVLEDRLARREKQLKPSSRRTYVSRARSAMEFYLSWLQSPTGWAPPAATKGKKSNGNRSGGSGSAKLEPSQAPADDVPISAASKTRTLDDEISEALVAMARWPKLRRYLLEGISQAQEEANAAVRTAETQS